MSFLTNFWKSLDIGGPTYWDGKEPPKGGLMGKFGVGQTEKNVKVGDTNFRFQAPDPRKELDKKAMADAALKDGGSFLNPTSTDLIYKPGRKLGQYHRIVDGKITLDQEAWKAQDFGAPKPEKKSIVKETVNAEETPEEETTVPAPPPTPKAGPTNNETGTGGSESTDETQTELSDVASVTVPKKKLKGGSLITQAGLLTEEEKKKLGLLS